jgi:hypothetical protein
VKPGIDVVVRVPEIPDRIFTSVCGASEAVWRTSPVAAFRVNGCTLTVKKSVRPAIGGLLDRMFDEFIEGLDGSARRTHRWASC